METDWSDSQSFFDRLEVKSSFRLWLVEVENMIFQETGLTRDQLPDCLYRDWFDAGMSASDAATEAICQSTRGITLRP